MAIELKKIFTFTHLIINQKNQNYEKTCTIFWIGCIFELWI